MKYKQLSLWENTITQNRLRSKVLWMAIAALVMLLMRNYGLYQYIGMTEEVFKTTIDMVLAVLVLLGIINNPSDADKI